jgi:hypothetical protein
MKTFSYHPSKAIILTNNIIQKTVRTICEGKRKKIIAEEYLSFGIMASRELIIETIGILGDLDKLITEDKSFFACAGIVSSDKGQCNLEDYIESRKYIIHLTDQTFKYVTSVMKEIHHDTNNPLM